MHIKLGSKWRMGILCTRCRLRPKSLHIYSELDLDVCLGHENYVSLTGLYIPEEYSVLVMVMR